MLPHAPRWCGRRWRHNPHLCHTSHNIGHFIVLDLSLHTSGRYLSWASYLHTIQVKSIINPHPIHGISGASGTACTVAFVPLPNACTSFIGRHCCLWCLIISENLILQPGPGVQQAECRTIESLCDDHFRFMQSGGNCKHAK